jgi:kinetochor protein Mis14/NSL1
MDDYARVDSALLARVQALLAEEEELTVELGELRRTAPARIAAQRRDEFESAEAAETAAFARSDNVEIEPVDLGIEPLERQDAVERTWREGVQGLEALRRGMGETTATMERARAAADYVLGDK